MGCFASSQSKVHLTMTLLLGRKRNWTMWTYTNADIWQVLSWPAEVVTFKFHIVSLFSDGFQTSVEVAPRMQHDNIYNAFCVTADAVKASYIILPHLTAATVRPVWCLMQKRRKVPDSELEAITGHAQVRTSQHVGTCHDIVQRRPGLVMPCSRNSYWYPADSDLIALATSLLDNSLTTSSWKSLLDEPSS